MDEPMIIDDERRDIVERLKSEKIPNLLGLYSAILGEEEKNNTYKLYQKLIKLIEPQTCKLNDYIDYVNDAIDINLCNAMLQGHLKGIARRCGVNPDEYHDSASLTFAIVDVLDKRLISESEITSNYEKRTEKTNEDIVNWINNNGGIDRVKKCVQYVKWIEDFDKDWHRED